MRKRHREICSIYCHVVGHLVPLGRADLNQPDSAGVAGVNRPSKCTSGPTHDPWNRTAAHAFPGQAWGSMTSLGADLDA